MSIDSKVLALDFDGCIADGSAAKQRYAQEVFGIDLTAKQTAEEAFPLGAEPCTGR